MNIEKYQINQPSQITNLLTTIALSISTITGCQCIKDKTIQNINRIPTNRKQAEQTGVLLITYTLECIIEKLLGTKRCIDVNNQEFCFDDSKNILEQIANSSADFHGVISVKKDRKSANTFHIKLTETSYRTVETLNKIHSLSRRFNVQVILNRQNNTLTISK